MIVRSALWELGGWYGLGLAPAYDITGQQTMFRWLCLGFVRLEVWRGTIIDRMRDRLPAEAASSEMEVLREEIVERDEMIRRQAAKIEQLEFELGDVQL